ncbi:MAG TPA: BamA/TamA family outer membrane protein [Thermoanaerobaculia bacterium]|nr:BamA/TamA family outer membrane protein [Thermoanaerobaculia bacterium]
MPSFHRLLLSLLLVLFLPPLGAGAEERRICPVPAPEVMVAEGATIGHVAVAIGDVFDPNKEGENRRLYRLVNRLHYNTRPSVVENLLLFRTGDRYDPRLLAESERLLRAQRYFYDATVVPVSYCDGVVDVAVEARDVWTLFISASYTRSGGKSRTEFELQDANFLGTGKDIAIANRSDVDRSGWVAWYRDKNLLGSRARLELWYGDNDDGSFQVFDVNRPFYSLDSRWAGGLRIRTDDRFDRFYRLGKITDRFRHEQDFIEGFYGYSPGLRNRRSLRLFVGATYLDDIFSKAAEGEPVFRVPDSRKLVYPWVGFEWVEDDFRTTHNLDQISRTEDVYFGLRVTGRAGWSAESLGADEDLGIFSFTAENGGEFGEKAIGFITGSASWRWNWESGEAENLIVDAQARYYRKTFGRHVFVATAWGTWSDNLDFDRQILLGGDNGLRGYPLRYQSGSRRFLISLEQRFYTDWHVLKLVHVGGAVFADVGRAWYPDDPSRNPGADEVLRDIGVGLRLGSSRSGRGTLVHFDIAFPFDGDPSIDDIQWLVTTKESF